MQERWKYCTENKPYLEQNICVFKILWLLPRRRELQSQSSQLCYDTKCRYTGTAILKKVPWTE